MLQIAQIWSQFLELIRLACCLEPKTSPPSGLAPFSLERWNADARAFGTAFVSRWAKEKVTTCIHILIYHVGFFIDQLGSIESYGNYVIEGLHQRLKRGNNCFVEPKKQCHRWLLSSLRQFRFGLQADRTEKPTKKKHWTELEKKRNTQQSTPTLQRSTHGAPPCLYRALAHPAGRTFSLASDPARPAHLPALASLTHGVSTQSMACRLPCIPPTHPAGTALHAFSTFRARSLASPATSLAPIPASSTTGPQLPTTSISPLQPAPDSHHVGVFRECACQCQAKDRRRVSSSKFHLMMIGLIQAVSNH